MKCRKTCRFLQRFIFQSYKFLFLFFKISKTQKTPKNEKKKPTSSLWTSLVLQVLTCTRKEGKKYQTNKRNTSNTNVHKHKQCKKNKNNMKKTKTSKINKQSWKEKNSHSFYDCSLKPKFK